MSFRTELNKHLTALPVAEVKKLVSKYNKELDIKPISKLKKAEIIEKIKSKKPMDKQLLAKLTNEARATVEGRKAQKASEKEDAKKKKEEPKKKVIKVKKSKNQPPKAKPDFLDLDKDGDKKEPMKKAAKEAKKSKPKKKMPSGVHIHLDGKTMKYNSVKEGQAAFDKIRSNRAKKPYKKMTLMDGDKVLDYSA